MNCEIVTTTTPDSVRLHGLYFAIEPLPEVPFDAAVVLHGLGGNFYGSNLSFRLRQALAELNIASVLANTRGHDTISTNTASGRAKTIGAAFEIVSECRHDVAGWVDWLTQRGHRRIVLVGHSLGAIKSLYAQAYRPHENVAGIIALSASRLSHHSFLQSPQREIFLNWMKQAKRHVESGHGDRLMYVDFPFPTHICASAYVDKYGPGDRYNFLNFVRQITVPTLLVFGELELRDNAAFRTTRRSHTGGQRDDKLRSSGCGKRGSLLFRGPSARRRRRD